MTCLNVTVVYLSLPWYYEKKVYFIPLVLDYIINYINELHVPAKFLFVL